MVLQLHSYNRLMKLVAELESSGGLRGLEIKEPPAEAGGVDVLRVLLSEPLNSLRPFLYLGH